MMVGRAVLLLLSRFVRAGAAYTELSGDCVTATAGAEGDPTGAERQTMHGASMADCEAACDEDAECSGFSYTAAAQSCVLKADPPYAGWCDAEEGACTEDTCFHTKTAFPPGFFIKRVPVAPYGHDACRAACAADHRQGRLTDFFTEDNYNGLVAFLGHNVHLDLFVGLRQPVSSEEPAGGWVWEAGADCVGVQGFQPPWHEGEPNNWAPRLEKTENCATMFDGKLCDVTCDDFNSEMGFLPNECLCTTHGYACGSRITTTPAPTAAAVVATAPPATAAAPLTTRTTTSTAVVAAGGSIPWVPIVAGAAALLVIAGVAALFGGGAFSAAPAVQTTRGKRKPDVRALVVEEGQEASGRFVWQLKAPPPLLAVGARHELLPLSSNAFPPRSITSRETSTPLTLVQPAAVPTMTSMRYQPVLDRPF